jgi:hypothetical protein
MPVVQLGSWEFGTLRKTTEISGSLGITYRLVTENKQRIHQGLRAMVSGQLPKGSWNSGYFLLGSEHEPKDMVSVKADISVNY